LEYYFLNRGQGILGFKEGQKMSKPLNLHCVSFISK
jgi:hypothetical protein